MEGKSIFIEFAGNLVPVAKTGEPLELKFRAFHENRLPFTVRVRDPEEKCMARILFMPEPKVARGEPTLIPVCTLNISLPQEIMNETTLSERQLYIVDKNCSFLKDNGLGNTETIHRADIRLADICNLLHMDWVPLATELGLTNTDIAMIQTEYKNNIPQQAMVMLRFWMQSKDSNATGNNLEKALRSINREDIVNLCIYNVELVTDDVERAVAKVYLDQSGFETFKDELGPSRDTSLRRNTTMDQTFNSDSRNIQSDEDIQNVAISHEMSEEDSCEYSGREKLLTADFLTHEVENLKITKGNCINSDSDSDCVEGNMKTNIKIIKDGPPRLKKKTLGSSSGSDVAMHEGADLSGDENPECDLVQETTHVMGDVEVHRYVTSS
uniref:Death domain-containing protein n=3 Tax=Clastoptera arizonana TaxID=38151 RepID=A0A1B6D724_9HEMI